MDEFQNRIPTYRKFLKNEIQELNKKIKNLKQLRILKFNKLLFLQKNNLNL